MSLIIEGKNLWLASIQFLTCVCIVDSNDVFFFFRLPSAQFRMKTLLLFTVVLGETITVANEYAGVVHKVGILIGFKCAGKTIQFLC